MSVLVYRDSDTLSQAVATMLTGCIIEKPASALGLDCSQTLAAAYRKIAGMTSDGLLDWATVRAFNLYEHIHSGAEQTDEARMRAMLYERVNIRPECVHYPNANAHNGLGAVCSEYEDSILGIGGLDTVVCAVGEDGRLAYNLPGGELAPITHVEHTPSEHVVTVGLTALMTARRVIAVLSGCALSPIAPLVINGPVTPNIPASYLLLHPNAIFMLDEDAAERV